MNKHDFIKVCDRAMLYSFYALIYFLPISTALIEIFSTIILTAFFCKRIFLLFFWGRKSRPVFQKGSWAQTRRQVLDIILPVENVLRKPIGFFLLVNLLSIFISSYPWLSLKGFFCKWVQGTFLFFAFLEVFKTRRQLQRFIYVYLLVIALTSFNGLSQFLTGKGFIHQQSLMADGRVASSFKHPNDFGGYLVVAAAFVLTLFLGSFQFFVGEKARSALKSRGPVFLTWIVGALSVLTVMNLGLTFSRGAWGSFIVAVVFLGMMRKRLFIVGAAVLAVFLLVFMPRMIMTRNVSFVSDDVVRERRLDAGRGEEKQAEGQSKTSVNKLRTMMDGVERVTSRFGGMGRNNFWKEAVSIIREFPALGVGVNTYSRVAPRYKVSWGGYPHNCYLQMAAEIGLLGLGAFLWIVVRLFVHSCRSIRLIEDPFLRSVSLGMLAGVLGYLVHSMFDTNFYTVQLGTLLWLCFAVIMGAQILSQHSR